jgi:hypothetical protein
LALFSPTGMAVQEPLNAGHAVARVEATHCLSVTARLVAARVLSSVRQPRSSSFALFSTLAHEARDRGGDLE